MVPKILSKRERYDTMFRVGIAIFLKRYLVSKILFANRENDHVPRAAKNPPLIKKYKKIKRCCFFKKFYLKIEGANRSSELQQLFLNDIWFQKIYLQIERTTMFRGS